MHLKLLLVLALAFTSFTTSAASHFPTNSIWRYFKGVTEASIPDRTAWRAYSFNDSAWPEGQAPFYFDSGPLSGRYTGNTELTDMQDSYNHVFLRRRFTVDDPALVYALKIRFQVDDGFVMWVNGRELYRQNVNPTSTLTNRSTTSVSGEPPQWRVVDLAAIRPASYLQSGENVIAIQLINATRADNDLLFDFALDTTTAEGTRPTITEVNPVRGSRVTQLTSVAVTFSEAVVGIDAGDLIVNGLPSDTMTQVGNTYTFRFTQPVYGQVNVSWDPDHNIIDASLFPNGFDAKAPGSTWVYDLADILPPVVRRLYPAAGSSVRSFTQLEVSFSEVVAGVEAADLLVNGQPATNLMIFPGGNLLFQFPQPAAGLVALQWRNGHGITDLATPALAFGGGSWVLTLDPSALVPDLVISEILAANKSGLVDEDGDQEAWIELWNRGTTPVNLEGWSLSDDPNEPGKWVFPSSLLGAGGRLVVFASGKDRPAPSQGNRFHTNFKLALGGEFLGLFSPESPRQFISGFASGYPEQRNDISYGWVSAGSFGFFNTPIPVQPTAPAR
ncbi:MAG: hypothetical protein FJ405_18300, partial [Verrucomicrobia bacterium]|nr:hypothetical protein [Verrucomicrobiota bacterium]